MTSRKLKKIIDGDREFLFQNYGERLPVSFAMGDGSLLYDQDNREYIDFFSGIAVSNIGYGHTAYTSALKKQLDRIIHTSNWYYNQEQVEAARLISKLSFPGKTLFANSGTEANEAAIKLVRRYGLSENKKRTKIITFTKSFHGRTFGSMSATAQEKIHAGFGPIVPGFIYLPFNDISAFRKAVKKDRDIAAVMIELVQGEGGINIADKGFVQELFALCGKKNILTVVDEVQTGVGRTGEYFAYQHYDVIPDIITCAKGLAGGLPVGALHSKAYLSDYLPRGSHGSTFGGNHFVCAGVSAVLKTISKPGFLEKVQTTGDTIKARLEIMKEKTAAIREIRGPGLHIGVELDRPCSGIVTEALSRGLIINCAAERVIRIMPPLTIPPKLVKKGLSIFEDIILGEARV